MTKTTRRRFIAWFLAATYIFTSQAPFLATSYFTRPGAGVSRMPLDVMAFNAPGFGQVEDAINLANGNVFMAVEGLARNNNKSAEGDEKQAENLDDNWSLSARLRLEGFKTDLTTAPEGFALFSGDGSGSSFTRATPDFTTAPSWLVRYQNAGVNVAFYRAQPLPGTRYSADWIVLHLRGANTAIAHFFDASGTRHTFSRDGHYLDFTQSQNQQFRSAKLATPDVDGDANNSPRTEITYEPLSSEETAQNRTHSGRIATVSDEYGRTTTYKWNDDLNAQTLDALNYFSDQDVTKGYVRRTEFSYENLSPSNARVIKEIRFKADDGRGAEVTRKTIFTYDQVQRPNQGYRALIKKITRDGANGTRETEYTYNSTNDELTEVKEAGKATTTYTYETSNLYQGRLVKITETPSTGTTTAKVTNYHYDTLGRLRERRVKDVSPVGATDRELIWKYAYVKSGALGYMSEPTGKTTHMYYDDRGNLIKTLVFATDVENPNTQTDIEVTASTPVTELMAGQTIQIASFVQNDPTGKGVTYLAASGEITPEGLYTAPTSIPVDASTSIVVKSKLDPSKTKSLVIALKAPRVTAVAPTQALRAGDQVQLHAKVDFTAVPDSVTYAVDIGNVDAQGVYTAPASNITDGFATVTATSMANPTRSTTIQIPLKAIEVKLATPSTAIRATEPLALAAKVLHDKTGRGVTWTATIGTISADGVYSAPSVLTAPTAVAITAKSITDPSKEASVMVQVIPLNITAYTPLPNLDATDSTQLAALLDDWNNTGFDWTASLGQILPSGFYTAPGEIDQDTDVTLTATSRADPSKSSSVSITVKPTLQVQIASPISSLKASNQVQLSAKVNNDRSNKGVTWTASSGTITASGLYTASSAIATAQNAVITARSVANPNVLATLQLPIQPLEIRIVTPVTSVTAGGSLRLVAQVDGDTTQSGITWSVNAGSISPDGVYSAPSTLPTGAIVVTAKSVLNPAVEATQTLSIRPLEVRLASPTQQVRLGGQTQLSARVLNDDTNQGVTWSSNYGSVSTAGVLTAPNSVPVGTVSPSTPNGAITVTATSVLNPSNTQSLVLPLEPLSVQIASPSSTLRLGQPMQFSARVTNDGSNQGVTWSANYGSINSSGLYTAPAQIPSGAITITATSKANPVVLATKQISLEPLNVQIASPVGAVTVGAKIQLSALVSGDYLNRGVTWSANQGSIAASGLYSAPTSATNQATVITATSVADSSKTAQITLPLNTIAVRIAAPVTTIAVGASTQFTSRVENTLANTGVTYTASAGTINASGLYTAPNTFSSTPITITATSLADSSKTASWGLTLLPIAVQVSAASNTVSAGSTLQISSQIGNAPSNQSVTWSLSSSIGSISSTGLYSAPNSITANTPITITATSLADNSKQASITLTVTPVQLRFVLPTNQAYPGQTIQLTGRVLGGSTTGVTYTLSPNIGSINASGVYTVPNVATATTVTVTAASVANPSKTVSANLTVQPLLVRVAVPNTTMTAGAKQQLSARVENDYLFRGVTWSASSGSISSTGLYSAANSLNSATTATITATSVADPSKSASLTINVQPLQISLVPITLKE